MWLNDLKSLEKEYNKYIKCREDRLYGGGAKTKLSSKKKNKKINKKEK